MRGLLQYESRSVVALNGSLRHEATLCSRDDEGQRQKQFQPVKTHWKNFV